MITTIHSNPIDNKFCDGRCAPDECVCWSEDLVNELKSLRARIDNLEDALKPLLADYIAASKEWTEPDVIARGNELITNATEALREDGG